LSFAGSAALKIADKVEAAAEKEQRLREGIAYYEEALTFFDQRGNQDRVAFAQSNMAHGCLKLAGLVGDAELVQKAITLFERSSLAFQGIGQYRNAAFDLSHAGGAAYKAAKEGRDLEGLRRAVRLSVAAAELHLEKNNEKKQAAHQFSYAAEFALGISKRTRSLADASQTADLYTESAQLFAELEMHERAAHNYSHAGTNRFNVAQITRDRSDYEEAIRLKTKSLELFRALGQEKGMAYCFSYIGNAWFQIALLARERGPLESARINLVQAADLFDKLGIDRAREERAKILEIKGML
jgi:hypothetical protein